MSNNQLQLYTPEIQEAFKPEVLNVIRTSIAPTATDAEFVLFAHKAATYGLDPFKNEIFFIKYGNTARIQFAAEAYLAKAREKEGFQPPNTQMIHENDEFKMSMNPETGELEVEKHDITLPRGKIIGAYSIAYRQNYRPVTVIMDIEEVSHMFTGQNKENWNKWTSDMFGKHVQQRALKKQYGIDFGDEEITQGTASNVPEYQPKERKDITHEVDSANYEEQELVQTTILEEPAEDEATKIKRVRAEMSKKFRELGITTKEGKAEYIASHAKIKGESPTLQEMIGLLKIMDMHIAQKQSDDDSLD